MQISEWESEKKELCQALISRLFKKNEKVTYEELLNAGLPSFLKSYLKSQVKRYFEEDKPVSIEQKVRYQFQDSKVQDLINQLTTAIQNATIFTEKEITEAINRTISLQVDFLVKPKEVLERVFYKTKNVREHSEILHAIIGISDDRPFLRHLIQILRNVNQKNISKDLFVRLAKEAEEEIYRQKPISAFIQDISVYFNFKNLVKAEPCKQIKKSHVPIMLRERNLNQLAEKLVNFYQQNNHSGEFIELPELEKLLESYLYQNEFENNKKETKASVIANKVEKKRNKFDDFEVDEESDIDEYFDDGVTQKIDLKKNKNVIFFGSNSSSVIGSGGELKIEKKEPEAPEFKKPKIVYSDDRTIPLTKKNSFFGRHSDERETMKISRKELEAQPEGPIPSLRSLIDARSKKMFIKKIFKKNEVAYNIFISKIEAEKTWKKAKMMIDEELANLKVDQFSREAIKLGDLVFSRYFPKKK